MCKLIRICAEHDDISDTNKIFTALQCLTILLSYAKQCPTMLLSGIILCTGICDIIAMSDNIIILFIDGLKKIGPEVQRH